MLEFRLGKKEAEEAISKRMQDGIRQGFMRPETAPFLSTWEIYCVSRDDKREEAGTLLGKAIQQSREQSNLTVQEVAKLAGLKPSAVMALEEGTIVIRRLAAVLIGVEGFPETVPSQLENLIKERET